MKYFFEENMHLNYSEHFFLLLFSLIIPCQKFLDPLLMVSVLNKIFWNALIVVAFQLYFSIGIA